MPAPPLPPDFGDNVRAFLKRLPQRPVTRFAPSPTGPLHMGHAVHLLYLWGLAQLSKAKVLLRVEDHDRQRSKPKYERAILDDLEWLGLTNTTPEIAVFRAGETPFRQTDNAGAYAEAFAQLRQRHRVYGCQMTRRELAETVIPNPDGEHRYPGTYRHTGLALVDGLNWRLELPDETIEAEDGLQGRLIQRPQQQCGDLVLRDRHNNWTYQFAVSVDDYQQGVNLIVRGADLLQSVGRQVLVQKMLGRTAPLYFFHHPLVHNAKGLKLSKRLLSTGLAVHRAAGKEPTAVWGEAAQLAGWQTTEKPLEAQAIGDLLRRRIRT